MQMLRQSLQVGPSIRQYIIVNVEPKARLLLLYGVGYCRWGTYAVHGARESRGRGRPEGALARAAEVGLQWAQREGRCVCRPRQ